jgi:hypothetical protein
LVAVAAAAQIPTYYPLREVVDSARFEVVPAASGQGLAVRWLDSVATPQARLLPIRSVALMDADLVLNFNTLGVPKGFSYQINTTLRQANRTVYGHELSSLGATSTGKPADQVAVVGEDATETVLEVGQTYQIVLRRQLLGTLDCAAGRPASLKNPWLPIGYAYFGAGALVFSATAYSFAANDYDRYQQEWAGGENRATAQPFLDRARRNRNIGHVVTGAGVSLIALDIWLKSRRVRRIQHQQHLYDEYCTPRTSWHLEPNATGLSLVYQF